MQISYQPLWNTLKELHMNKEDLRIAAGLTNNIITNMCKCKQISMETLLHICGTLNCNISQIPCQDGKLYISPILDCYNGEILSLIMRDNMKKELCIDAFHTVTKRYKLMAVSCIQTVGASIPVKHSEKHYLAQGLSKV